ncbi:GNAT family N-acetyltransferase [Streptococcus panodentis]|uniref:GNAT family N-acetyltransferase n=1 Tax=Streptococcus panodentis TaxID=1581472 RepID=A0ABS5AVZ6_9STRE|nr:GNAT family N-acetyltransferase [Streptococcus panodentis]MBP2620747.1 GNAT family N-acetyltransferase [Streptococcus panodentis]
MELRRPTLADKDTILEMLADFEAAGGPKDGFFGGADFVYEDWLETIQLAEAGLGLPDGFVPYIQLVSFNESGRALGFANLRLRLNEDLLRHGGHIGYSIRPSARGCGLAKEQLRQALQLAKSKNIPRVLVTCSGGNPASRAVIVANGGSYEDSRDGTERYWIDLAEE